MGKIERKASINDDLTHLNYLGHVRRGDYEFSDAKMIAVMIIDPNGSGYMNHWRKSAVSLLIMAILHTLYARKNKTLTEVVNYLSNPKQPFYKIFDSILRTEHDPNGEFGWVNPLTGECTKTHPI